MENLEQEIYVVDFALKNNKGNLKDCVIFQSSEKGQESIQDAEEIEYFLDKDMISFQNRYCNGNLRRSNTIAYHIHKIKLRDF